MIIQVHLIITLITAHLKYLKIKLIRNRIFVLNKKLNRNKLKNNFQKLK